MKKPLQRILLVEDDTDIQAVALLALEAVGGFTVGVCSSGPEALDKVGGFAPDLILLDVMMPGMDGLTTFQALRALPASADIPVVFMTARVQANELAHYKEIGARDVISKPFDPMTMPAALRAIWEQG